VNQERRRNKDMRLHGHLKLLGGCALDLAVTGVGGARSAARALAMSAAPDLPGINS
jgi:hypothetical protein